jgi:outer membrane receptor protein involved in Fe transport
VRNPSSNTGYFGQVRFDVANSLFLTAGVRAERNANFGADFGTAVSPRVGVSYARQLGQVTVKLRASYGESIRPPFPFQSSANVTFFDIQRANPHLGPERQRGGDGGLDVQLGRTASFGVSYYNQRAIDLIDRVLVDPSASLPTYQYQNAGRIKNEGWEFEGRLNLSKVVVSGTFSLTNSTVRQLAPNYSGNYQIGDKVLGIPHSSAGGTITYAPLAGTNVSASVTYFGTWTGNDWIALYGFYYGGQPYRGSGRDYWLSYPSVTKFTISVNQDVNRFITGFVRAENVGDNLRYESNNVTTQVPRTVIVGARFRY